jgi:uncharacterized protein
VLVKLSHDEANVLLRSGRLGRLGCITADGPYVVPVNYVFADNALIIHSLPGRKIDAMRCDARVCLEVDQIKDEFSWSGVIAYGLFEEVTEEHERASAINKLLVQFPMLTHVEAVMVEDAGVPAPIVFRIRIERVTGLRQS